MLCFCVGGVYPFYVTCLYVVKRGFMGHVINYVIGHVHGIYLCACIAYVCQSSFMRPCLCVIRHLRCLNMRLYMWLFVFPWTGMYVLCVKFNVREGKIESVYMCE
jgi:hypothetical protein